jgi:hypothetical protein
MIMMRMRIFVQSYLPSKKGLMKWEQSHAKTANAHNSGVGHTFNINVMGKTAKERL